MNAVLSQGQFAFSLPGGRPVDDELGLWRAPVLPQAEEGEDFAIPGSTPAKPTPPPDLNHFLASLPDEAIPAQQALERQETHLQRSKWGLDDANRRLIQFAEQGGLALEASFSMPGTIAQNQITPELELQRWLEAVNPQESFATLPKLPDGWKEAANGAATFFTKIYQLLTIGDLIESQQGGQRIGLTVISLSGDFTTIFSYSARHSSATLHEKVLSQAISTRSAWLGLATSIIGGAARLAILFPTSPWLAIPAAYQFFHQVLQQVQNWPAAQPQ